MRFGREVHLTGEGFDDIAAGFPRFALGLSKKVIIADSLNPVVRACFDTPSSELTFGMFSPWTPSVRGLPRRPVASTTRWAR